MNRSAVDSQRGFLDRFRDRRMREHHHADILSTGAKLHGNGALLNQLGSTWANGMYAQHAVSTGVSNDLNEACRVIGSHGTTAGSKREHPNVDRNAFCLELLLSLADAGNFRMGIDNTRNQVIVDLRLLSCNALGNHDAFFGCLMCQHRATHHITNGVDTRYAGGTLVIDIDKTAFVQIDAAISCQQVVGFGTTAYGNNQLVKSLLLLAVSVSKGNGDFLALDFTAGQARTQADIQSLPGQGFLCFFGNLFVNGRQELVLGLDHCNFGAQARPDGTQFQTNNTSANNSQTCWHGLKLQRTGGVHDHFLVNRCRRNVDRLRTGGDDDVVSLVYLAAAIAAGHFDLALGQHFAVTFNGGDLVGHEQTGNTSCQIAHDSILALDHFWHVHAHIARADTMYGKAFFGLMVFPGAVQQCLGRNTANVQTGTTQRKLVILALELFDTGSFQAQLGSTNGGNIATRACTNYDYIKFVTHEFSSVVSLRIPGHRQDTGDRIQNY